MSDVDTQVVESPVTPADGEVKTPVQTPVESATTDAPETPKPDEVKTEEQQKADEEAKRGKSRFDRKIDRLYAKAAQEKARADFLEQQLKAIQPAKASTEPDAPKVENFSTIEDFANAVRKHAKEQAIKEYETTQQAKASQTVQQQLATRWETASSEADAKYEDFDEVVGELKPTTPWAMAIMQADNGADIAYHLGQNMKEAERIASLDPVAQIREIGRLEAKLLATPPTPKTPSQAPKPIKPVGGASTTAKSLDDPNMSDAEWIRLRNKEVHVR